MSADNWAVCPNCKVMKECAFAKTEREVKESYGKIPAEEYLAALKALTPPDLKQEFREDYELGVTADGEFYVSYSGTCRDCGFNHVYKHSEQLALPVNGKPARKVTK